MMVEFKVGDTIQLTKFPKKNSPITIQVEVIEVVEKDKYPTRYPRIVKGRQVGRRDHVSYVVQAEGETFWPLVSRLSPIPSAAQPVAAPVAASTTTAPAPGEHVILIPQPDGSQIRRTVTVVEERVPAPAQLRTDFIICLDSSGSMQSCRAGAVKAFNDEVATIRREAERLGIEMPKVTLWYFGEKSDECRLVFSRMPADALAPLAEADFHPNGWTPLFDCVGDAIVTMQSQRDANDPNLSIVLHVITDGDENRSRQWNMAMLQRKLAEVTATDRWSIAFMLPKGKKKGFCESFGIPAGNVVEWEATEAGAAAASIGTQSAVGNYLVNRSKGVRSVKNFFQPDLSNITDADLAKLRDLSLAFRLYDVKQEMKIKEFVEGMTKRPYVIGSGYYQLVKREKLQAHKAVLLRDRFTGKVYGGLEARKLIGLQHGQDVEIEPGNHSKFDIFHESDSVNRILPRGSKLLHDFNQVVDKQPTWDHTAGQQPQPNAQARP